MSEVTAAEMKRLEQQADAAGLSYRQMMENAGAAAAALALRTWPRAKSAAVFCGKGNNGGDGFVAARHLANAGLAVRLYLVEGGPVTTDAIYNCGLAREMGLPVLAADTLDGPEQAAFLQSADIILDGVYGTGFHGTLRPEGLAAARRMNDAAGKVLALDVQQQAVEATRARLEQEGFGAIARVVQADHARLARALAERIPGIFEI